MHRLIRWQDDFERAVQEELQAREEAEALLNERNELRQKRAQVLMRLPSMSSDAMQRLEEASSVPENLIPDAEARVEKLKNEVHGRDRARQCS